MTRKTSKKKVVRIQYRYDMTYLKSINVWGVDHRPSMSPILALGASTASSDLP
jgi:hypothetical protein